MKRRGVLDKFKKILVAMIISITMFFSMPVKSNAGVVTGLVKDFINILLGVPDGIMWAIDGVMAGNHEFESEEIDFKDWDDGGHGAIHNYIVTPYEIFSSGSYEELGDGLYTKIGWLDVNFFSEKEIRADTVVSSNLLAPVIGNIYKLLRNLCMILMLLVILYIGIKIMISSIAEQQAKYKKFLIDWVVGFALLFAMHYIMSGIMAINSTIVGLLSNDEGDSYYLGCMELEDNGEGTDSSWYDITSGKYDKAFDKKTHTIFKETRICVEGTPNETVTYDGSIVKSGADVGKLDLNGFSNRRYKDQTVDLSKWGDNGVIYLAATVRNEEDNNDKYANKAILKLNAMSYMRTISDFGLTYAEAVRFYEGGEERPGTDALAMGYSIMYLCMVLETIMFLFTYIKRVLQMAFLTMIAPLVAIMYPVDKLGDGKAQAFNTWFKDYLFNMLIQPMHLLLYTVFIVAAGQLVSRNILYGLAIYGFMIPAEKYFKKILGFEKAPSGGGGPLGGSIGHSLAMDGLGKLAGIGPAATAGKSSSGGDSRRKPKLSKNKPGSGSGPATAPRSGGIPESGGSNDTGGNNGAGGNNSTGGNNDARRRSSNNEPINGNRNSPGADGNGKKRGVIGSGGKLIAKKLIKGFTGGAYGSLNDLKHKPGAVGKKSLGNVVGKAARFTGKSAFKLGGGAIAGGIGAMVGAATAMATGDINNLWKGATVGAGAGSKMGANLYNRTLDGFGEELKAERAKEDKNYNAKLRTEKAYEKLNDELGDLNDDDYKKYSDIIDRHAQYVDFDSLKDVKAMYEAENSGGRREDADEAINTYLDAKKWSDIESHEDAYLKSTLKSMSEDEADPANKINEAQVKKILDAHDAGDTTGLNTTEMGFYKKAMNRYNRAINAQGKL